MASKFAVRLAGQLPDAKLIGRTALKDYTPRERMIDAELQEVRDVLDALLYEGFHCDHRVTPCDSEGVEERARALLAKLEVK